jgi:hypothetical protein
VRAEVTALHEAKKQIPHPPKCGGIRDDSAKSREREAEERFFGQSDGMASATKATTKSKAPA